MHIEGAEALRKMLSASLPEVRGANVDLADTFTNEFL